MKHYLLIGIILISGLLICGCVSNNSTPNNTISGNANINASISPYAGGFYFPVDNGTSKIYLINSTATYGTFGQTTSGQDLMRPPGTIVAHAGDPCVIISGYLRNDYNRSSFIDLSARLYDVNGNAVGEVLTDVPTHTSGQVYAESNSTVSFLFTVKYDKKDISRYEISAFLAPGPLP